MKISIIGSGNLGRALATGWIIAGHEVMFGTRSLDRVIQVKAVKLELIPEAAAWAEVIVLAAVPSAVQEIAKALGDVSSKIIIDAMNSVRVKPDPFSNTTEALLELTNCKNIVKCFNTTGAENVANPSYSGTGIDMFYAGDSDTANKIVARLANDLGFENIYNFGGSDKFNLLEQFAVAWINLAMMQGYGRDIAFKVLKR